MEEKDLRLLKAASIIIAAVFLIFIAVNHAKRPDKDKNESAAIASLKAVGKAMESWRVSKYPPSYSGATLAKLARAYPSYIDSELSKGTKDGYSFIMFPPSPYEYFCMASPISYKTTGSKTFRITRFGIVEVEVNENWQPAEQYLQ